MTAGRSTSRLLDAGELGVVRGLADGLTNPEIAARLRISTSEVGRRLVRTCVKLNVGPDRAGIVGAAIRSGQFQVACSGSPPARFDEGLFELLVRIARGRSTQEIADELHLTLHGVKSRVQRLLLVLDAGSRPQAVARGVECGVLRLVPATPAVDRSAAQSGPARAVGGRTGASGTRESLANSEPLRALSGRRPVRVEEPA